MHATTQVFCGVMLAMVFGGGCVSAVKCYACEPGLRCDASVFIPLPGDHKEDCLCCTKSVTSTGTTRSCSLATCIPVPSVHFVCASDYCNGGQGLAPKSLLVGVLASASAAILAAGRLV